MTDRLTFCTLITLIVVDFFLDNTSCSLPIYCKRRGGCRGKQSPITTVVPPTHQEYTHIYPSKKSLVRAAHPLNYQLLPFTSSRPPFLLELSNITPQNERKIKQKKPSSLSAVMSGTLSKRQQARNERALQDLIKTIPGNSVCADCSARNPGMSYEMCLTGCCSVLMIKYRMGQLECKIPDHAIEFMSNRN